MDRSRRTHVFMPDPAQGWDWRGQPLGGTCCALPKKHPVHAVPEVADDSARIVGEREDREEAALEP